MNIKAQQRFTPILTAIQDYTISFPMPIAAADDIDHRVVSSNFSLTSQTCIIRNRLNTNILQVVNLNGEVIIDNIGSYNPDRGIVSIVGFRPDAIEGESIRLSVTPANQSTIRPLRNYILSIDESVSFSQALIDFQDIEVVL